MTETVKPGYAYKDGNTTAAYAGNRIELKGAITTIKIANDGASPLDFVLNQAADSVEIDGVVKAGEVLTLDNIDQGVSSIGVKSASATAYRLWAYY